MKRKLLLSLICCAPFFGQAQDDCNSALDIIAGEYTVEIIDGNEKPTPVCTSGGNNADFGEWYKYTPTENYGVTLTTDLPQNAGGDTRFHVYTGECGNLTCFAGDDDDGNGYLSYDTFNVTAGVIYYIAFDDNWNAGGFDFQLIEGDIVTPPPPAPVTFSPQNISTSGSNLAVVDMNGDFLDDLVSVTANNVNIQFQQSSGGFTQRNISTPHANFTPSWSLAAGDFNADGYNDLLYGNGSGVTFMRTIVDEGNVDNGDAFDDVSGFTELSSSEYVFSQRSNFADINNDGHLDAFVCHDVAPSVSYINVDEDQNGVTDGKFDRLVFENTNGLGSYSTGGNYGSIWIDYDNDRDLDMFLAKCGGGPERSANQMHTNDGNGNFIENASELGLYDSMQTWSSAWGDFDNDGDMDVFVGASSGAHKLMENNFNANNISFSDATNGSGISQLSATSIETVTFDLDNDGNLDVISGGNVLIGNGDLTFEVYEGLIPLGGGSYGDVNNDGFIDAFNNGTIYMNNTNDNNWIKIVTVGMAHIEAERSNRNGIGARVEIHTEAGVQIRDVRSGDGFRYMNSLNTHFGIGTQTSVNSIVVYWPSGVVDTVLNPSVNETIVIEEGFTLSINDETLSDLTIYPNPVKDNILINSSTSIINYVATVVDINGKRLLTHRLKNNTLNVSDLQSGVYFLRLESQGKSIERKFIKQ